MQYKLLFLILLLSAGTMQAQQVLTNAGGYNSNTSGSLSWTLGECVINTYTGTNLVLTQGFQQSKLLITSFRETPVNSLAINIYPNPASDFVWLKASPESVSNLRYVLYDLNGNLLAEQKVTDYETKIPFHSFASGTYLLKLISDGKEVQVLKIVKL